MAVVVIPFHCGVLDGAVHAFDLPVGPWMVRLGQSVLNPVGLADHVETHLAERHAISVSGLLRELDAVIGEDRVDLIGHSFQQVFKELPSRFPIGFFYQLRDREFAGSINGDKEVELAFVAPDLGNINVEVPNRVSLELLPFGLVTVHVR